MAGQRSVSTRVDAIEHQLQHVQALANATAKGFGKDKVQRQWVVFAQGEFRARLEEAWGVWKEGAGKVRSEGGVAGSAGSADKPQPFKVQVFGLVKEQLGRQGLAEDVCQGLAGLRAEDVVESLQVREPPEDVSKPWVLVVLFRPTWSGLSASQLFRAPAVGQVVGKQGGSYPALGLRPGRFLPGELQRKVMEDMGHGQEDIRTWFSGKGGGKGGTGGPGPVKRAAGARLSLSEERDKKR